MWLEIGCWSMGFAFGYAAGMSKTPGTTWKVLGVISGLVGGIVTWIKIGEQIVVEYGGQWWPQYSEVNIGYSPRTKRYEFSTPARIGKEEDVKKAFIIRAILVDSSVHQRFQNWFQQHIGTEHWPGIPITEVNLRREVKTCDYINVIRQ